ncbi:MULTISPECIES: GNAT family N-acetyltransferase [Dyella]|uniref:GNAT family N-acetyltransferase n=2 Tax=Dyella TaxID=231454 RepID=A0A4R0YU60_9GAMM|nr:MULTISPECIES: GNAT family N-acetyltransferase [Dyella]TBR39472.1 GNAT family N-acetyltransferase [Dyella terrae]TCI12943.1 GNAT family N-acetyltransferase [Dyella soli]
MLSLLPYEPGLEAVWDGVVDASRNGTLQHRRAYMDYHRQRFSDASLIVMRKGMPVAVFPAHRINGHIVSHGGLSHAGLILSHALRAEGTLETFDRMADHYRAQGCSRITYKPVPHVFQAYPAEDDLYALQRRGARLARRELSTVIGLQQGYRWSEARRHAMHRAEREGVTVGAGRDWENFHTLLTDVLASHDATPTHSLGELRLLHARFPGHILLHEARREGRLLAGVVTYDYGRTVHTQYMAASEEGRACDALSLLLGSLIRDHYASRTWFSFGISTEQHGDVLNEGLVAHKESFGGRSIVHDTYEWTL